jgi:YD repeat-containing protein
LSILKYQYDVDNRLTNRWSLAKGNTQYVYDNVGNLTGVTYPANHSLSFSYDNINELTSISDGIGTRVANSGRPGSLENLRALECIAMRTRITTPTPETIRRIDSAYNNGYSLQEFVAQCDRLFSALRTDGPFNPGPSGLLRSRHLCPDGSGPATATFLWGIFGEW